MISATGGFTSPAYSKARAKSCLDDAVFGLIIFQRSTTAAIYLLPLELHAKGDSHGKFQDLTISDSSSHLAGFVPGFFITDLVPLHRAWPLIHFPVNLFQYLDRLLFGVLCKNMSCISWPCAQGLATTVKNKHEEG